MDVDGNHEGRHAIELRRPRGHLFGSAVVSGDSEQDDDYDDDDDGSDGDSYEKLEYEEEDIFEDIGEYTTSRGEQASDEKILPRFHPGDPAYGDELYDQNLDDEDEAYVYRHMRGGVQETVMVRNANHSANESAQPLDTTIPEEHPAIGSSRPLKVLKPRNSDAVLSCPCCFNIVCMDCQRHQKYLHQFRAMFVMGITVDWQSRLIYDDDQQLLVPKPQHPLPHHVVPTDGALPFNQHIGEVVADGEGMQYNKGEYFPVLCGNCQTPVAALDMIEEVYHFHGCLESS